MLHPSYTDLMEEVNKNVEEGESLVVNSRYSIVMATAKRARQIIAGAEPLTEDGKDNKPLSIAVEEMYTGKIRILDAGSEEDETSVSEEPEETSDDASEEIAAE